MPEDETEGLKRDLNAAAEQLLQQHQRMVDVRKMFADAARQNVALYARILEEQALMKRELVRLKGQLKRLSTARK